MEPEGVILADGPNIEVRERVKDDPWEEKGHLQNEGGISGQGGGDREMLASGQ